MIECVKNGSQPLGLDGAGNIGCGNSGEAAKVDMEKGVVTVLQAQPGVLWPRAEPGQWLLCQ